jgi:hypothetical protein
MLPQILAMTIGGPDGVDIGIAPFIVGSLPFIVVITLVIMLTWYFMNKKRLEHQQILAAIEKGTPLSELMPVKQKNKGADWIKSLSKGIMYSLMGIGLAIIVLSFKSEIGKDASAGLFLAVVLFSVGVAGLVSGILKRKAEKALSSEKSTLNSNQEQ